MKNTGKISLKLDENEVFTHVRFTYSNDATDKKEEEEVLEIGVEGLEALYDYFSQSGVDVTSDDLVDFIERLADFEYEELLEIIKVIEKATAED